MIVKELVDVCCPEEVQVIESRQVDPVEALQVGQSFGQPRHVLHDKQKEIVTHAHKLKKGYLKVKSNSLSTQSFKKIKAQKRASDFFSFLSLYLSIEKNNKKKYTESHNGNCSGWVGWNVRVLNPEEEIVDNN